MPLLRSGQLRKRWRYIAAFSDEFMICAARAQVGPLPQCFWVLWDRREGRRHTGTSLRPGSREVTMDGPLVTIDAPAVEATLRLGDAAPIEARCPSGRSWGWTRKRAGMPIEGEIVVDGERRALSGRGVDDQSAGYHRRHTSWHWSAGVGHSVDGRDVAWNLVEGINDPPSGSERAIWVAGEPHEPQPVSFDGLDAIRFPGDESLAFSCECERTHDENFLLLRSRYRLRFGTFSGALGALSLSDGLGVMEEHDALW